MAISTPASKNGWNDPLKPICFCAVIEKTSKSTYLFGAPLAFVLTSAIIISSSGWTM